MVEVVLIGSQKNFLVSRYETNLNFTDSITFHANIYNEIIIIVINLSVGMSFGLDMVKNREAITALHRDGIIFATNPLENRNNPIGPPPNLGFLEICGEFSNKLLKQEKKVVLQFLDRMLTMGRLSPRREWEPLLFYRNSLVHGETDPSPHSVRSANRRRRRDTGILWNFLEAFSCA